MATRSALLVLSACSVMLVLACALAGCSSSQSPVTPAAPTPVVTASAVPATPGVTTPGETTLVPTTTAAATTSVTTAVPTTVATIPAATIPAATTPAPAPAPAPVMMRNFAFSPETITVKPGTTVTWTNQDAANHDVVSDSGMFSSPVFGAGSSFQFTFNNPGTYTYHCSLHPSMKGTVIVQA